MKFFIISFFLITWTTKVVFSNDIDGSSKTIHTKKFSNYKTGAEPNIPSKIQNALQKQLNKRGYNHKNIEAPNFQQGLKISNQ